MSALQFQISAAKDKTVEVKMAARLHQREGAFQGITPGRGVRRVPVSRRLGIRGVEASFLSHEFDDSGGVGIRRGSAAVDPLFPALRYRLRGQRRKARQRNDCDRDVSLHDVFPRSCKLSTSTMAVRRRSSAHKRWTGRGAHAGPRIGSGQHPPLSYPFQRA